MAVTLLKSSKYVRNWNAPVRGTDVTCYVGVLVSTPHVWRYSLWAGQGDNATLIAHGSADMSGMDNITPDQFARAMYLCDVIYNTHDNLSNRDFVWTEEIHPDL
jgi:hypothetical protein